MATCTVCPSEVAIYTPANSFSLDTRLRLKKGTRVRKHTLRIPVIHTFAHHLIALLSLNAFVL